jgi:hypothetical protein
MAQHDRKVTTAGNIGLPQAGLMMELHTVLLSTYICAWRQVVAFKPRLRQAVKRYRLLNT